MHDDVPAIVSGKLALRYAGQEIEAMKKVAKAAHDRSLADFRRYVSENRDVLEADPVIHAHLDSLYDQMLEQNLLRIIEPYSKVEVKDITHFFLLKMYSLSSCSLKGITGKII